MSGSAPLGSRALEANGPEPQTVEVSVVIPCLNEAGTLAFCIESAQRALRENGIRGEIIVADNGSSDDSANIASTAGARVVTIRDRGYGSALMGGIGAANGKFIVMGDADASYDFGEIPRFVEKLREGNDLVQGCRLSAGGGHILPGAMPFLHRFVGNPMFSMMARWWFRAPIHDIHCGMRGFTRELFRDLEQRCTGMEFASEMVIKSVMLRARVAEVPITLKPDGRISRASHLRTFRDGWRHLRFFLLYCPRWLFLIPGGALIVLGLAGYGIAMPGLRIRGVTFDVHTLLFASLSIICGYQSIVFAFLTKVFAISEGLLPKDRRVDRLFHFVNLEKGLAVGAVMMTVGVVLLLAAVNEWRLKDFGDLDYVRTMRWVIPGLTLTTLGFQTILSSFFLSILGLRRR